MESQHHLAASSGAGSKNQDLVGVNEGKGPVRTQEVLAGDDVADNDLSWLRLQAATREQARRATKGINSGSVPAAEDAVPDGNIFSDDLIELIRKHQELDPYCMRIARQRLHPRRQLNQPLAATGPVVDTSPALTQTDGRHT
jgi:hypothetical protein